jgi:protein-disulfide isomerase
VSDEERDDDVPAEPAAPRLKKKKRRAGLAEARSAAVAPEPAAEPTQSWTNAHLAAALAAGLVLGGLGGYLKWGKGEAAQQPVASDAASSQAPARGAQATARPQQPTPEPATPVYIPLAAWTPREGPEHAKVTILEYSDFQ